MSNRLTTREGSKLRLTRATGRPSPFDRFDVASALGATQVVQHTGSGGNPTAKSRWRGFQTRHLVAQSELSSEDLQLIDEVLGRVKARLATVVDRGQIVRALVHRELEFVRKDPEQAEEEIAAYLTTTAKEL